MTVYITFTTIGADAGPFTLYSNADGFASAFATGVTKAQLMAGFPATAPNGTTVVRAKSSGACINYIDMSLTPVPPTTTSTTTPTPSTTTTTTPVPTTTTTTTLATAFFYNVTTYTCGTCPVFGGGTISNPVALVVGKFYYHVVLNLVVRIDSMYMTDNSSPQQVVFPSSQQDTCAAVICTTTSTTTAACAAWRYFFTTNDCATCANTGSGVLANSQPLTIGKWYYYPLVDRRIQITSFDGCEPSASVTILNSTGKDTCAEVICGTTTTTTTAAAVFTPYSYNGTIKSVSNGPSFEFKFEMVIDTYGAPEWDTITGATMTIAQPSSNTNGIMNVLHLSGTLYQCQSVVNIYSNTVNAIVSLCNIFVTHNGVGHTHSFAVPITFTPTEIGLGAQKTVTVNVT